MPNDELTCKLAITSGCITPVTGTCLLCKEPICDDHRSEDDPDICVICFRPENVEIAKAPLVDTEGVTHKGAIITPTGNGYRTLAQRIAEMDDVQLAGHIEHGRQQVREAERVLDYRRIDLAISQNEQEERTIGKGKNLRMHVITQVATGTVKIGTAGANGTPKKGVASALDNLQAMAKLLNIPVNGPGDLMKLAGAIAKLKGAPAPVKK